MNQKVYDKAIKLLDIRLHTIGELEHKLRIRKYQDQDIKEVIKELKRLNFLDDQYFTQIFVENTKAYKDFGYYGIKARLMKRFVPNDMITSSLDELYTLEDELVVAQRLVAKLKSRGRDSYEKLARSLSSRGFRNEIISKVIKY